MIKRKLNGVKTITIVFIVLFAILPVAQGFGQSVTITWDTVRQEIDGFGASGAFRQADDLKSFPETERNKILDLLFSQTTGIGLSIVRNMVGDGSMSEWGNSIDGPVDTIEPSQGTWNYNAVDEQIWFMQEAKKRGCTRFMSTVWSPPKWMKSNNSCINGGSVLTSMYPAFADYLVNYANEYLKNKNGLDLYAISVTNEPNLSTSYSSCQWTADQLRDFVKNNLGPKMRSSAPNTKIMVGEDSNWTESPALSLLNDATGVQYLDIVASHNYNNSTYNQLTTTKSKNKKIWETEVSNLNNNDRTMTDGLKWAIQIHDFMVNAEGNAWLYWWGMCYKVNPEKGEGLINMDMNAKTWFTNKRLFTMGNFSRFVRPGWFRLTTSSSNTNGVRVTAYKNGTTGEFAVVAINDQGSTKPFSFTISGNSVTKVTPYVTSASLDLAKQSDITASGGTFTATLAATSVTTFVGGSSVTPTCTIIGDVNGSGARDIVDALLLAQFYVGLAPANFIELCADVNCDGSITIVDALLIAQCYVGLTCNICQ